MSKAECSAREAKGVFSSGSLSTHVTALPRVDAWAAEQGAESFATSRCCTSGVPGSSGSMDRSGELAFLSHFTPALLV